MADVTSEVWDYFRKNNNKPEHVTCELCKKELSYKSCSTTSLIRHLSTQHSIECISTRKRCRSSQSSSSSSTTTTSSSHNASQSSSVCTSKPGGLLWQPTLQTVIKRKEKLHSTSDKAKKVTLKVVKMICKDLQPLSVVEDEGFRDLLCELEPRYVLPTRTTFRQTIVPKVYQAAVTQLKSLIQSQRKQYSREAMLFSVTTDAWSSRDMASYITYTLHLTNPQHHRVDSFVLSTQQVKERHTATFLRSHLIETLKSWGIIGEIIESENDAPGYSSNIEPCIEPLSNDPQASDDSFCDEIESVEDHNDPDTTDEQLGSVVVTTDNASNITKALEGGFLSIRCFAHTINLGVQKFISTEGISDMLTRIRAIVKHFHHSTVASQKLTVGCYKSYCAFSNNLLHVAAYFIFDSIYLDFVLQLFTTSFPDPTSFVSCKHTV